MFTEMGTVREDRAARSCVQALGFVHWALAVPVGVTGRVQQPLHTLDRGDFAYIFVALTWMLTSQKEKGASVLLRLASSPFQHSCHLPSLATPQLMPAATSVSHAARREKGPSSTHY